MGGDEESLISRKSFDDALCAIFAQDSFTLILYSERDSISNMCVNSTKGRNYVYKRNYIGKDLLNHEIGEILIRRENYRFVPGDKHD